MASQPEVTIVIPTRDRWRTLSTCGLRAALLQKDVGLEVVVVDDGSTDETPAELAAISDPRVRTIRHDVAQGVAAARNAALELVRGKWIAYLDDDDLWAPRKLRLQLDAITSPAVAFVVAGVVVVDDDGDVVHVSRPAALPLADLLERNTVPAGSSNVLARADLVREVGGFDERLSYVADWDLWIRLASHGPIVTRPEPLVAYVRRGEGMRFSGRTAIEEMRYFVDKHRAIGIRADPARFLAWVAGEDRRAGRRGPAAATYFHSALAHRRPRQLVQAAAALVDRARATSSAPAPPYRRPEWLSAYV